MDWKIELVAIPVSDVDRAKAFYTEQAGFNADHDHTVSDEIRFVQLTPPGSACSIALGKGITTRRPARRRACRWSSPTSGPRTRSSAGRGRGRQRRPGSSRWGSFVFFKDPDGNGWAVQQLPPREPAA